jgi:hypothetical protein
VTGCTGQECRYAAQVQRRRCTCEVVASVARELVEAGGGVDKFSAVNKGAPKAGTLANTQDGQSKLPGPHAQSWNAGKTHLEYRHGWECWVQK